MCKNPLLTHPFQLFSGVNVTASRKTSVRFHTKEFILYYILSLIQTNKNHNICILIFPVKDSGAYYYPSLSTSRVIKQRQIISAINRGNDFHCQSGVVLGCSGLMEPELWACLHWRLWFCVSYRSETPFCVHVSVCASFILLLSHS